jgi:2-C-methyl-D-erythritol 4-phosphate cytidylyltransferase
MRSAVIVAGGSGTRMKSEVPKQFLPVNGVPVLFHTLKRFYDFDPCMELMVVLPPEQLTAWAVLCKQHGMAIPHKTAPGGKERFHSVIQGVNALSNKMGVVNIKITTNIK